MKKKITEKNIFYILKKIHPAIYTTITLLIIWEFIVRFLNIASYILPTPSNIAKKIFSSFDILIFEAFVTLSEALLGLLFAFLFGVVTAIIFQLSPRINKSFQPIVAGLQSFPKEAIAPLFVVWFGFGITSKVIIACSIAFFPIFLSTLQGLNSVPDEIILTFRAIKSTKLLILYKVRLPYSLPLILSGVRIASTLSIVGAVIGEFVGSSAGLGRLILISNSQFSVDLAFGCLFILGIMGMILDSIFRFIEKKTVYWHESAR